MSFLLDLKSIKDFNEEKLKKIIEDVEIKNSLTEKVFFFINVNLEKKYVKLPFYYGIKRFKENEIIINKPFPFDYFESSDITLRDYQKPLIEKSYFNLINYQSTIIEIPPGAGKTLLSVFLSVYFNEFPIVIITPSSISSLPDQWFKTIQKFKIIKDEEIIILDEPKKQKEINDETKYKIIISSDLRVKKINLSNIKMLILDEAHFFCTEKRCKNVLLNFFPKRLICLSATLTRSDGTDKVIRLIANDEESVIKKPELPFKVFLRKINDETIKLTFNKKTKKMDFSKYCKDICNSKKVNEEVIKILREYKNRKFIILSKIVEHTSELKDFIENEMGEEVSILSGKLKKHEDRRILIGTIPKLSTGYDAANASINFQDINPDSLILIHPIKSWQLFEQCKGRIMRISSDKQLLPFIFCLGFDHLKFSFKHILNLKQYIEDCNGQI